MYEYEFGPMPPIAPATYVQAASTCGHWQPYPDELEPGLRTCLDCRQILRFDKVRCYWEQDEEAMETRDQIRQDAETEK